MENIRRQPVLIMAVNFALAMLLYMAERWFFFWMNHSTFQDVTFSDMMTICGGGIRFDVSALCYLNILCIAMQTIPAKFRDTVGYQRAVKIIFLIINTIGIFINVADVVYFDFGGRRTTATFFSEFGNENNLGKILLQSVTQYWPVWIFGVASIFLLWKFYYNPVKRNKHSDDYAPAGVYYTVHSLIFVVAITLAIGGLRGGFGLKMHPLRQDSADIYCKKPVQAAIVLNTPFTILTTIHKTGYKNPEYYPTEQLTSIFNPVHQPADSAEMRKPNIVVILMESFSREYVGYFNKDLDDGKFEGYTPFLDSLLGQSYCFANSFANGVRSVDCMPGVFAGIPRYIEPYCYYFYSNNTLQGLPEMLGAEGYHCAFFHGAPNTTLGFKGFTNSIGFTEYYGMDEFNDDSEFDGTWSIWDEPFFQYFAHESDRIAKQGKPFLLTIFSASSHNPFKVPEKYDDGRFPDGTIPMHKAVRYADYSLKKYFETVSQYDWYKNTIFVFTADHTGPGSRDEYANEYGKFRIPIFFYTPGEQLPVKCDSTRLIQQMDITPTLLSMIGYDKPYFSFGKNVFEQDSAKFVNYVFNDLNGQSMYYLDTLMIEYKNNELTGIFEYQKDYQLTNNLIDRRADFPQLPFMESQIKAIIQEYVEGMKQNSLTAQRCIAK